MCDIIGELKTSSIWQASLDFACAFNVGIFALTQAPGTSRTRHVPGFAIRADIFQYTVRLHPRRSTHATIGVTKHLSTFNCNTRFAGCHA